MQTKVAGELPGGEVVQRAEVVREVDGVQAALAVEPSQKLLRRAFVLRINRTPYRVLRPVFVVVLFRHVVLRHFVGAHFALIRVRSIFHSAHNSRFKRLAFF